MHVARNAVLCVPNALVWNGSTFLGLPEGQNMVSLYGGTSVNHNNNNNNNNNNNIDINNNNNDINNDNNNNNNNNNNNDNDNNLTEP